MTIYEAFEILPKSDSTLVKHKFQWKGLSLKNDLGHPCEYRVIQDNNCLGMVKYYRGRLLACYQLIDA